MSYLRACLFVNLIALSLFPARGANDERPIGLISTTIDRRG